MILRFTTLFFAALLMSGCENEPKRKAEGTWFGGEVVNPTDHIVTLKKGDTVIAEIPLNQNHRFLYQLKNLRPGLYEFYHKERQLVYLDEGDSVMLRLNTYDFDESLTFSGYGAIENNLLISLFLKNEEDNSFMSQNNIYRKNPEKFSQFMDSLGRARHAYAKKIGNNQNFSPRFEQLVNAIINYDLYARKEYYPLVNATDSKMELINELPDDFYSYHKDLSFDQINYLPCYAYKRFLIGYFNLAAFKKYAEEGTYDNKSYMHINYEMRLIDSLVPNRTIKSYLLTRSLRDYLTNNGEVDKGQKLYDLYLDSDPDRSDRAEMETLFNSFKKIAPRQPLPDETVINTNLKTKKLRDLIQRPTVLYFWSSDRKRHMQRAASHAETLREHFPQYDVIGLNLDHDPKAWLRDLNMLKSPGKYAYQFKDREDEVLGDLAIHSSVKTIITDKNGIILDAHANMFSRDFEEKLLGYLNTE